MFLAYLFMTGRRGTPGSGIFDIIMFLAHIRMSLNGKLRAYVFHSFLELI